MQKKFRQLVGIVKPGFSNIEIKNHLRILYRTKTSWRLIFIKTELIHGIARVFPTVFPPCPRMLRRTVTKGMHGVHATQTGINSKADSDVVAASCFVEGETV